MNFILQKNPSRLCFEKRLLTIGLAAVAGLALSGCGPSGQATNPSKKFAFVHTIDISTTDTVESIESQYQGKVVSWQPDAGFAVLGSNQSTLNAVNTSAEALPTANTAMFAIAEGKQALAGGKQALAGGTTIDEVINAFAQATTIWEKGWMASTLASGVRNASFQNLSAFEGNMAYMLPVVGGEKGGIRLAGGQALANKLAAGVKVAVIDTGIDLEHPAFKGVDGDPNQPPHLAPPSDWKDFVDNDDIPQEVGGGEGFGHGSGVAGIITQVAPNVQIMPIRVLGPDGAGDVTSVVAGIEWAVKRGAKVINLSLGSSEAIPAMRTMIKWATSKGVFVVASAGNTNDTSLTYPAADAKNDSYGGKRLISVGSVGSGNMAAKFLGLTDTIPTKLDVKSVYSTFGGIEILAPGELIATVAPNQKISLWTGTSFAAPMVSGTLALALGQPLTSDQKARVADAITLSATGLDTLNPTLVGQLGKGRLDVAAFMDKVLN